MNFREQAKKRVVDQIKEEDDDDVFFDIDQHDEDDGIDGSHVCIGDDDNITKGTELFEIEKCGQWLLSIPRDDVVALKQTPEFTDFLKSFQRLGQAHRRCVTAMNRENIMSGGAGGVAGAAHCFSFLQHMAVDDVVLRVLEYLECRSLIRTSMTCSRFRALAHQSATQRTHDISHSRQLDNVMKLLRAKEEIEGVVVSTDETDTYPTTFHVPVPMLGLSKRVLVSGAGDPEYNGVYYCTGCNGNGFVFTKPRDHDTDHSSSSSTVNIEEENDHEQQNNQEQEQQFMMHDRFINWGESPRKGESLRCMVAKRFSNETILWYMSKEVETTNHTASANNAAAQQQPEISQIFSFWAKLMVIGDATPDICQYPSPTSILSRNGDPAWQPLSSNRLTTPPIVELID